MMSETKTDSKRAKSVCDSTQARLCLTSTCASDSLVTLVNHRAAAVPFLDLPGGHAPATTHAAKSDGRSHPVLPLVVPPPHSQVPTNRLCPSQNVRATCQHNWPCNQQMPPECQLSSLMPPPSSSSLKSCPSHNSLPLRSQQQPSPHLKALLHHWHQQPPPMRHLQDPAKAPGQVSQSSPNPLPPSQHRPPRLQQHNHNRQSHLQQHPHLSKPPQQVSSRLSWHSRLQSTQQAC